MAKFDGVWRCFLVTFNPDNTKMLDPIGKMHLRFEPNGELDEGRWEYNEHYSTRLEGVAAPGRNPRGLELEDEGHNTFEGVQTFESGDQSRMIITGKFHVSPGSRVAELLKDKLNAQDDPPWVITKP